MFEKRTETRKAILKASLRLFRKKGFDKTTMREIAEAAGLATGAAYYYFPSKEAILLAYYEELQARHLQALNAGIDAHSSLEARLHHAYTTAIDSLSADHKILHVVLRYLADRDHPLSVLGPATAEIRAQSQRVYETAVRGTEVSPSLVPMAARALWALHMGIVLFFFYDDSPKHARTYALIARASSLAADMLSLASSPVGSMFAAPLIERIETMLVEAGIVPAPAASKTLE